MDFNAEGLNQCTFSTFTFNLLCRSSQVVAEVRYGHYLAHFTSNKISRLRRLVHLAINTLNYFVTMLGRSIYCVAMLVRPTLSLC